MSARDMPERFLVAFSFAGKERALVQSIAEAIESRLGRGTVFFDEWFEHCIAGGDADLRLQKIYGHLSTLVVPCISKAYGEKPWTSVEFESIRDLRMRLKQSGDKNGSDRILPIRVGDGDVEGILTNSITIDARSRSIDSAAQFIVERLRIIQPDSVRTVATIFLAETTPDLRGAKDRRSVEIALRQSQLGYRVLPAKNYGRSDLNVYRMSLDEDLSEADLFVQILGESGSDPLPGHPYGFEGFQFTQARTLGKPCLRWRPKDLDLAAIKEFRADYHRYLTDGDESFSKDLQADERVQAGFLAEFTKTIEDTLAKVIARKAKPARTGATRISILLAPQNIDSSLAEKFDEQSRHAILSDIADESYKLTDVYEDEAGLVVIYGQSPYEWVKERIRQCREIALNRAGDPPVCAIFIGPPDSKPPLPKRPTNFRVIHHQNPEDIEAFLADLSAKGPVQ